MSTVSCAHRCTCVGGRGRPRSDDEQNLHVPAPTRRPKLPGSLKSPSLPIDSQGSCGVSDLQSGLAMCHQRNAEVHTQCLVPSTADTKAVVNSCSCSGLPAHSSSQTHRLVADTLTDYIAAPYVPVYTGAVDSDG
jgi:hypothetical protein